MTSARKGSGGFLGYVHYFRAIAILYVVCGHMIDAFSWETSGELERLLRILFCNGSTLFVFIAGFLFQHLSGRFETRKYFASKLRNVLLPYVMISIPAIVVFVGWRQRDDLWPGFYDSSYAAQVVLFLLTGRHLATLWFIPMISLIFLAGPLLARLDKDGRFYLSLPLWVMVSGMVSRGLPYQNAMHFFSAYLLGMACSRYKETLNGFLSRRVIIASLALLIAMLAAAELVYMQDTMTYLNYLQKLCLSLFFIGLLVRHNDSLKSRFVNRIADTSFGIYFVHAYVIFGFKSASRSLSGHLPQGQPIWLAGYTIVVLLLCMSLVALSQRVLGTRSRMLVGS